MQPLPIAVSGMAKTVLSVPTLQWPWTDRPTPLKREKDFKKKKKIQNPKKINLKKKFSASKLKKKYWN